MKKVSGQLGCYSDTVSKLTFLYCKKNLFELFPPGKEGSENLRLFVTTISCLELEVYWSAGILYIGPMTFHHNFGNAKR